MFKNLKQPEQWKEQWDNEAISAGEYFQGLIYSAKFSPIENILSVLDENELARFTDFLHRMIDGDDDEERVKIGLAPEWELSDGRAILSYLNKHHDEV